MGRVIAIFCCILTTFSQGSKSGFIAGGFFILHDLKRQLGKPLAGASCEKPDDFVIFLFFFYFFSSALRSFFLLCEEKGSINVEYEIGVYRWGIALF